MKFTYNVLDEPWIPVLPKHGPIRDVSLRELLLQSHNFREIAHDSPLFVASILTLCIALLQSAWELESYKALDKDWKQMWDAGQFDADRLERYFNKWHGRFDLFDEEFPFYQTAGLNMVEASDLARLAMEENNAPAMFANLANPDWKAPSSALACQLLVTIQNFALGFGKSSRAKLGTQDIDPPYSADGPLLRGLTIWPSGETFFQTLMLNLVPHERSEDDLPCWELDKPYTLRDTTTSAGRKCVPTRGICDLLTLQSRLIRLLPVEFDGRIAVPTAYFTQGRSLDKGVGDFHPFKLYIESKLTAAGTTPLALSENKAIWRNSTSLFSRENRQRDKYNTFDFSSKQMSRGALGEGFRAGLDVVGMATDPGKAGKFMLWRHDRLPVSKELLLDENAMGYVISAITDADELAEAMRRRFRAVARSFIMPEKLSGHSPDPEDIKNFVAKFDPRTNFWPLLEHHFLDFLRDLSGSQQVALEKWQRSIESVANDCFRNSCNALGKGPNAVVAVAQVKSHFSLENMRVHLP